MILNIPPEFLDRLKSMVQGVFLCVQSTSTTSFYMQRINTKQLYIPETVVILEKEKKKVCVFVFLVRFFFF